MKIVVCPNCSATLFLSAARGPRCGNCGHPLDKLEEPSQSFFKRWFGGARRGPGRRDVDALSLGPAVMDQNLKNKIDRLAKKSWGSREEIESRELILNPLAITRKLEHDSIVSVLLKHVDRIATALSIPRMVPRIVTQRLCDAAGQFVEESGWVKIVVGANFFDNLPAAKAILCHELCHYVLEANGIRERPTSENERMTDSAIFVFGLGDVFLEGYKRAANSQYRVGHRLGYLTDGEYTSVSHHVRWLRKSEEFLAAAKGRRDDWNWDRSLRW